jgi:hypothetical protein
MSSVGSEHQSNKNLDQNACAQNSDTQPTPVGEVFKRPHLKMLNLMKPSLSLTSLPPQSPKEPAESSTSTERPYNSLKVNIEQTIFLLEEVRVLIVNNFFNFFSDKKLCNKVKRQAFIINSS